MTRVAAALVLFALLGAAACGDDEPAQHPLQVPAQGFDRECERRAVMRCLLSEEYSRDVVGDGHATKRFVLDPELIVGYPLSDSEIEFRRERGLKVPAAIDLEGGLRVWAPKIEGLDPRLIADWASHARSSPVPRDLDLPLPIDWFTEAEWDALKGAVVTGDLAFLPPKLQAFHAKHPDSAGWIRLSDVGFSPGGHQALLYVTVVGGWGGWYLLEKRDGRWAIAVRKMLWIS